MRRALSSKITLAAITTALSACASAGPPRKQATEAQPANNTVATETYFRGVRHDPGRLLLFLRDMPKGGDLHNHLGGAIYAESFIRWADEDGLCLVRTDLRLKPPPCDARKNEVPASTIPRDPALYGDVIDAWSMRNWHPSRKNGHDQFFDSFAKFGPASSGRTGDMIAEVAQRAADENVSYLELMQTLDGGSVASLGMSVGFDTDFAKLADRLVARGLRDTLKVTSARLDKDESRARQLMRCDVSPRPASCDVVIRYLYQVLRGLPPQIVFAQILAGFELARMDHRVVGFNLVMPEDDPVPMRDFRLHMRMIDFLHDRYPEVKITLHAGELAEGLVPPEGMRFHIRESIERGHAQRIGHGTDILFETNARELMQQMAARKILVEVSLSSSDGILGIKGPRHPIGTYLRMGVPVALATDDEGVSRSSLTLEYRKAVEEQDLEYRTLKEMSRNSILYSFVEDGVKLRLLNQLDSAFTKFEVQYAGILSR